MNKTIDFSKTYRLNSSYYFSAKGEALQIVNVVDDDNFFLKIDGTCKTVFEELVKNKSPKIILESLLKEPNANQAEIEEFLSSYIADLIEMGIIEG